ncbi:MAG: hypothetical protein AB7I04_02745 [Pseudomonadales bacterium]
MRPRPGDVVSRRKGPFMHRGLVLADGRILHNSPFRGEHVVSESEFRGGHRLHVSHTECPRRRRFAAAAEPGGRGYNVLTNNCEHTVNRALTGEAKSPQLVSWIAGIGVASVAFALTRHPAVTAAGYALGRKLGSRF